MAEQLLDQVRDVVDGPIDFEGQKLAETLSTAFLCLVGAISFLVGYTQQDIALALKVGLGGTALTFVAIVPPWPFFNKNPVTWLPVGGNPATGTPHNIIVDESMFTKQQ